MKSARVFVALPFAAVLLAASFACQEDTEKIPSISDAATLEPSPEASSPDTDTTFDPTASPTSTESPPTATSSPAAGWERIENTRFGYAVDYPADWFAESNQAEITSADYVALYSFDPPLVGHGGSLPPDKVKLEFVVLGNEKGLTLPAWVDEYHSKAACAAIVKQRSTQDAANVTGIRETVTFSCGEGQEGLESLLWFFQSGGNVIVVNGPRADSTLLATTEEIIRGLRIQ